MEKTKNKIHFVMNETKTDVYIEGTTYQVLSTYFNKILSKNAKVKIQKVGEIYYDTFDNMYNVKILKPAVLDAESLGEIKEYLDLQNYG